MKFLSFLVLVHVIIVVVALKYKCHPVVRYTYTCTILNANRCKLEGFEIPLCPYKHTVHKIGPCVEFVCQKVSEKQPSHPSSTIAQFPASRKFGRTACRERRVCDEDV